MKIWMIVAVFGLLAVAGFAVADSLDSEVVETESPSCGEASCNGGCSAEKSCGSSACGASIGKSCGCGRR